MKQIYTILAVLALLSLGFLMGRCSAERRLADAGEAVVRTDTLTVRDTLREPYPVVVDVTVTDDAIEVPLADIVIQYDSLVVLPMETKTYEGENYSAQVSGYCPQLDWVEVFPETKYITRETISAQSRKRWGLGLQAGYGIGVAGGKVQGIPYLGVGISFDILQW